MRAWLERLQIYFMLRKIERQTRQAALVVPEEVKQAAEDWDKLPDDCDIPRLLCGDRMANFLNTLTEREPRA